MHAVTIIIDFDLRVSEKKKNHYFNETLLLDVGIKTIGLITIGIIK